MNRGGFQGSLLQQMAGTSPNSWWSINNLRPTIEEPSPLLHGSLPLPSSSALLQHLQPCNNSVSLCSFYEAAQEHPQSWSQLLLGGLVGEEERYSGLPFKKELIWEEQMIHHSGAEETRAADAKHESPENNGGCDYGYGHGGACGSEIQTPTVGRSSWSPAMPISSPGSCVTTSFSCNMLDFSNTRAERRQIPPDHSSEGNSVETGAAKKKAKVQGTSSSQCTTFKVRKEKLGDRITALHQMVSPFGKTDTASVLLEAIGYIRFLQGQIQALSSPYLNTVQGKTRLPLAWVDFQAQGERSCIFPEDPGQLLNDNCMKRRGPAHQDIGGDAAKKDLRSRGLCLVPLSCTLHVGGDDRADYWSPYIGGGFR
ncbi:Transcription factor bHLH68 [Platanthera zijinensis]|uniref:Transcription factor bHLH68 n=1 Tax=Platanthera zijinensis TaxID=2320716 RepID=A0AAP0GF92_9ASPA